MRCRRLNPMEKVFFFIEFLMCANVLKMNQKQKIKVVNEENNWSVY